MTDDRKTLLTIHQVLFDQERHPVSQWMVIKELMFTWKRRIEVEQFKHKMEKYDGKPAVKRKNKKV